VTRDKEADMAEAMPVDNRSKIILGVDDNQENLMLLRLILETRGYSFVGAASGHECLAAVARVQPKLILLDIKMPDLDGFETCRRLRSQAEWRSIPVAFLTACKTREDVRMGVAAGGNDFIVKPFDRDRLIARVLHWVGRKVTTSAAAAPTLLPAASPGAILSLGATVN
jgi:two-component system, OmpR family, response regulator